MNGILAVAERELRSAIRSPVALAVLGVYLALHGVFFAQLMEDYSSRSFQMIANGNIEPEQNLVDMVARPLVMGDVFLLLLLLPALSMRQMADEWRQGTSDLLLSYPLREIEIVLGKFLASCGMLVTLLAMGAIYPLLTSFLGAMEWGVLATGFLGILLFGASVLAVGLLFSALTENQVIAFVSTVVTLLGVSFVGWWGSRVDPPWSEILRYFSFTGHVDPASYGVLRTSDIFFFLSVTVFALYLCSGVLEAKRWRSGGRR